MITNLLLDYVSVTGVTITFFHNTGAKCVAILLAGYVSKR